MGAARIKSRPDGWQDEAHARPTGAFPLGAHRPTSSSGEPLIMTSVPPGATPPEPSSTPPGGGPVPPGPTYYGGPPPGHFVPQPPTRSGPGPIPLRPLGLGDYFDAAFKVLRRNPSGTVGNGMLVALAFGVLPLVLSVVVGSSTTGGIFGTPLTLDPAAPEPAFTDGDVATIALLLGSSLLMQVGSYLVFGLVAHATTRAAIGERVRLGDTWTATRPVLGRLIALSLLVLLVGLTPILVALGLGVLVALGPGGPLLGVLVGLGTALLLFLVWVYVTVRYLILAPTVLAVERVGLGAALARAGRLVGPIGAGPFWRLLGIYLLLWIVASLVAQVVAFPLGIAATIGQTAVGGSGGLIVYLALTQLASVLAVGLIAPFLGVVRGLAYLDQRYRREAFDAELVQYVHDREQGPDATSARRL